jgi:fumarate hydratase subunit alpha
MPKGGGCENMSRFKIMLPAAGKMASANSCYRPWTSPVAIPPADHRRARRRGFGGVRDVPAETGTHTQDRRHQPDAEEAEFEAELLGDGERTRLGLGPQAVGGRSTALAVHMMTYPTHVASLPVAVNLQCHSARLKEAVL